MDSPILQNFVTLTIFSLMLAIGLNFSLRQLTSLWRRPEFLVRSLLGVIVLVPALVGLLLLVFDLPIEAATGLAVLAAAPGAPLLTKRAQMAGGEQEYAASLQLTLALLAVVVTPITLTIFYARFELGTEGVTPVQAARQIAQVTLLPVTIGVLLGHFAPGLVAAIARRVVTVANALFLVLFVVLIVLLVLAPDFRSMLLVGWPATAAIAIMVAVSLAVGHLLGGPRRDQRTVLAVACIARNVGLALYIVGLCDYGPSANPTILTYMILGAVLAVPYAVWSKRRLKAAETGDNSE